MAGGYTAVSGDQYEVLVDALRSLGRRLAELETPTGTSMNSLVDQVQQAIADINTTVTSAISANSYTKTEIDGKIAAPGNVTSTGQIDSAGAPLKSQPSYAYMVTTSYKSAWIDGVTFQVGYSPSSAAVKTDLVPMDDDDVARLLQLTPYWGRYLWDDPSTPPKLFFLASDVQAAGYGPDVAPTVETEPLEMVGADGTPVLDAEGNAVVVPVGEAYTVNYSQMVVPIVAALKSVSARLDAAGL